jgi:hypothetical protein
MKLRLEWTLEGDLTSATSLFLSYTGGVPSASDMTTLVGDARTFADATLLSLLSASYSLNIVELIDLSSASGHVGSEATSHAGTRSGAILPVSTSALVNYGIARRYRGGRPRSYFPFGVDGDLLNNQQWASAFVTAVNAGVNGLIADLSGISSGSTTISQHVNVSYFEGFTNVSYGVPTKFRRTPTPRVSPLVDPITSVATSQLLGSQRRRTRA